LFKSRTRAVIGPFERANGTCVSQLCYRFVLRSPDDSGGSGGLCGGGRAAAKPERWLEEVRKFDLAGAQSRSAKVRKQ